MGLQRHVGTGLKQTNKKHKGVKKRSNSIGNVNKSHKSSKSMSKLARKQITKQHRQHRNKMLFGSKNSADVSLMCLLVPLHEHIDLELAQRLLCKGDSLSSSFKINQILPSCKSVYVNHLLCPSIKKNFIFINGHYNNVCANLDLARLSDWIIFILPGNAQKIETPKVNEMLSILFAQGISSPLFCVMSNISDTRDLLSTIEAKFPVSDEKVRILNSTVDATNLLRHMSQSQKKTSFSSANDYLTTPNALNVGTCATRLRCGMLVEGMEKRESEDNDEEVYLELEGLLRGWNLPLCDMSQLVADNTRNSCPFIHLTGWGDFPLRKAAWIKQKIGTKNESLSNKFTWQAASGPDENLANELTAAWDGMQIHDDDDEEDNYDENVSQESQESDAKELIAEDFREDEEEEMAVDGNAEDNLSADSTDDETDNTLNSKIKNGKNKAVSFQSNESLNLISTAIQQAKNARIEHKFPDEVETPLDIPARERFKKFRGFPSFNTFNFLTDKESDLPYEYGKIFRFANYAHNRRSIIKYTLSQFRQLSTDHKKVSQSPPLFIPSNSVAVLTIGPMSKNLASSILQAHKKQDDISSRQLTPLTIWSLLPYERCLSVLHLSMNKRLPKSELPIDENGQTFDPDPIIAKEPMLYQIGIRRFIVSPIYSQASKTTNSNLKMNRYFTLASSPIVATMYGPVAYAPQPVLQFRISAKENITANSALGDLVATGSLISADPARVIVKRILLSGHPYKIQKRTAVVRYMFHTPDDIAYFKPIQMHTSSKAVGHIKQSVGTHGRMKCLFDRTLKASDVVFMPLYKRVFPKMTYDSQATLKLAPNNTDVNQSSYHCQGILKSTQMDHLTCDEEAMFT